MIWRSSWHPTSTWVSLGVSIINRNRKIKLPKPKEVKSKSIVSESKENQNDQRNFSSYSQTKLTKRIKIQELYFTYLHFVSGNALFRVFGCAIPIERIKPSIQTKALIASVRTYRSLRPAYLVSQALVAPACAPSSASAACSRPRCVPSPVQIHPASL